MEDLVSFRCFVMLWGGLLLTILVRDSGPVLSVVAFATAAAMLSIRIPVHGTRATPTRHESPRSRRGASEVEDRSQADPNSNPADGGVTQREVSDLPPRLVIGDPQTWWLLARPR
jgi:hypothetical protein